MPIPFRCPCCGAVEDRSGDCYCFPCACQFGIGGLAFSDCPICRKCLTHCTHPEEEKQAKRDWLQAKVEEAQK